MRVLGLDPGLRATGWGIVDAGGGRLAHVANGIIASGTGDTAIRLTRLYDGIMTAITDFHPEAAAVEETFLNRNPASTLKLGLARGVVLLAPARAGLPVAEYSANHVKKAVVGAGHAAKEQVAMMIGKLLPGVSIEGPDAADALAVAICHAHHMETGRLWVASAEADR